MAYTANPVWSHLPNWDQGITERLSWKTDQLRAETLAEQRITRRLTPRRTFEASFLVPTHRYQEFTSFVAAHRAKRLVVPIWHNVVRLTSPAASGTNVLSVDTRWREFEVGGLVCLINVRTGRWEVHTIQAKTDSSLTLISNLEQSWIGGENVYPAALARTTEQMNVSKISDSTLRVTAEFLLDQRNAHSGKWMSDADYRGSSIWELRTDDSEDLSFQFNRMLAVIDNEIGLPGLADTAGRGMRQHTYRWAYAGAEKQHELRRFLYYLCGRRRSVWLPTYMNDFTVVQSVSAFQSTLRVANNGYTSQGARRPGKEDIRIELRDGYVMYRRIVSSVEVSPLVEELTLDAPIFFDVEVDSIAGVSFLACSRLEQDEVEILHSADVDGLATTVLTWVESVNQGEMILTSRPYLIDFIDSLDASMSFVDLRLLPPIGDELDAIMSLDPVGTLRAPLITYTFWPFDALDCTLISIEPTGTLRSLLLLYPHWPFEAIDCNLMSIEPTGTLLVKLITYAFWPFEAMDASMSIEPTGTLA